MEVNELRQCPIVTARELMYERFTNVAGPFVECLNGYILDDLHLAFTERIEMSTLEAWLVGASGDIMAMFSVFSEGTKSHVLLDYVQYYSEERTNPRLSIISVASEDQNATYLLARAIQGLITSSTDYYRITPKRES